MILKIIDFYLKSSSKSWKSGSLKFTKVHLNQKAQISPKHLFKYLRNQEFRRFSNFLKITPNPLNNQKVVANGAFLGIFALLITPPKPQPLKNTIAKEYLIMVLGTPQNLLHTHFHFLYLAIL